LAFLLIRTNPAVASQQMCRSNYRDAENICRPKVVKEFVLLVC
jgi:hypothetical protein